MLHLEIKQFSQSGHICSVLVIRTDTNSSYTGTFQKKTLRIRKIGLCRQSAPPVHSKWQMSMSMTSVPLHSKEKPKGTIKLESMSRRPASKQRTHIVVPLCLSRRVVAYEPTWVRRFGEP
jgi:hypothetical protein